MKHLINCILNLLVVQQVVFAQEFLKRSSNKALSFKEMQVQFDSWKKSTDLSKQKHWKNFKRWEMETQLHTDAQGEPVDPALYVDEIVKATQQKEQQAQSRSAMVNSWLPTGPFDLPINQTGYLEVGMGRINCIAFHPSDPNTFFVGVAQGGVWKTSNGGQTWTPLTDNLPIMRVSDIAIDPINPNTMYISLCDFEYIDVSLKLNGRKRNTHYGLGLYKTTDGGQTWAPTSLSFQMTQGDASLLRKTIIHPTNTNKLVVCGTSGMYTSNDAGVTFTKTLDSLFWDLVQDPSNANTLYAASGWLYNSNTGNAAIYKSLDFGQTWTMLNTGIPATGAVQRIKLAIAPSDPNYIYALTVDIDRGLYGFYTTTDAGLNWTYIAPALNVLDGNDGTGTGGQGTYDLGLLVDATNRDVVYTGGVNLWGSADGAQTFNPVSHWTTTYGPTTHADIHSLDRQALTGNIFTCNDGGVYRTSSMQIHSWVDANNGIPWPTQWTKLNDGLQITSFYRLSSSRNTNAKLMAGAQDNSTYFFNGQNWSNIFGGDGMDNYINPLNDSNIIGSSQFGNFNLSFDNGVNGQWCNTNVNGEVAEWTTPIIADYNNPGTLYTGYVNVTKSTDGGNNWTAISNFPTSGIANNEISALAVAPSNGDVLFAAKRVRYEFSIPASMYTTTDGGANWTDVTAGLPDSLYYTSVEINDTNAATAYVSMAGFTAGVKVMRTTNGGTTWQNISYNLPNLPVNCVKSLPGGRKLLAATDVGVYILEMNSTTWVNISNGLPNVIVSDIEINQSLNRVYVSTFGRGIWETDLDVILKAGSIKNETAQFQLYPSLGNGEITISIAGKLGANEKLKLEVVDIMGRLVHTHEILNNENRLKLNLASGKYFAKLSGNSISGVKSFVIQ
ncbi:MAG: T9SS type A sorting domain-containing protein [Bacteroidetes bacterium]|nr:T9SS type A sorting domain-containing protein [Bacteroidota bacterium]MBK9672612.1 T9SS type A sorting domain-containing protein [Bacteroidota bacterium]MBK9800364.1 T9SS type A sorting domain-containing protein [Bacteroidota bacterium]